MSKRGRCYFCGTRNEGKCTRIPHTEFNEKLCPDWCPPINLSKELMGEDKYEGEGRFSKRV